MELVNLSFDQYLTKTDLIDFSFPLIVDSCQKIQANTRTENEIIQKVFEYVRDEINHSNDINEQGVTCTASEVILYKHGICCAKANLLCAMLRFFKIPVGFCYQKLKSNTRNCFVLHGLNAVYLRDKNVWIRLDARGNNEILKTDFSLDHDVFVYQIDESIGEQNHPDIFPEPNNVVIEILKKVESRTELWEYWDNGLKSVFK